MNSSGRATTQRGRRRRNRHRQSSDLAKPPAGHRAGSEERSDANLVPAIATTISIARADVEECVLLLRHADDLAGNRNTKLALERVLDVEPRLFETQHLLNAATRLYRIFREASPPL